jgi:hypothetical protein
LPADGKLSGRIRLAELPAVFTVTVTEVGVVPLSATEVGDSEHVDPAGALLQLSATV